MCKCIKVKFLVILFLCSLFSVGCGESLESHGNKLEDDECGDLGYVCPAGSVCKLREHGGYFCGCEVEGMANCPGASVCGTMIKGDDKENCGGCGKKCIGDDFVCKKGKCVVDDGGGLCGDLGYVCPAGTVCKLREHGGYFCGCKDERMATCSASNVCGTMIKGEDKENCGGCGQKCSGEGSKCEGGNCVCYEDGKVVDLKRGVYIDGSGRSRSCGVCGYECVKSVCKDGKCVVE